MALRTLALHHFLPGASGQLNGSTPLRFNRPYAEHRGDYRYR